MSAVPLRQVPAFLCGHLEDESSPGRKDAGDYLVKGLGRAKEHRSSLTRTSSVENGSSRGRPVVVDMETG